MQAQAAPATTATAMRGRTSLTVANVFALIVLVGLFSIAVHNIVDPDFWWHLRTGQLIYQERSIPRVEIFSWTASGTRWVNHEWLSELLFYAVYRLAGFAGLILSMAAVTGASFWLAYKRCAGSPYIAAFVTIAGAIVSMSVWGVRPQMFSLLLASIFLYILDAWQSNRLRHGIWMLPALMLPWANLHAGYPVGVAVIIATIGGVVFDDSREKFPIRSTLRSVRPLFVVLGLSIAAVMVNPNGWRLYAYPVRILSSPSWPSLIDEWRSPDFHLLRFQMFAIFMLATFALPALSRRTFRTADLAVLVLMAYASLQSVRHLALFSLVAIPVMAGSIDSLLSATKWHSKKESEKHARMPHTALNLFIVVAVLGAGAMHAVQTIRRQAEIESTKFPASAVRVLREHQFGRRLFNAYEWGGYLIWSAYPEYRVYVDGRAEVYGERFVTEFANVYLGSEDWHPLFRKYQITTAVIHSSAPLARGLRNDPEWQIAFEDANAVIFTSKSTAH